MLVRLNEQAVDQLEWLMKRVGYDNHMHCLQVLISTVKNNLVRKDRQDAKKQA